MKKRVIHDYIEKELLSGRAITSDEELLVSEQLDSLAVMRLVAFIEKTLGIRIPPKDVKLANFATIDAISAYLSAQMAE